MDFSAVADDVTELSLERVRRDESVTLAMTEGEISGMEVRLVITGVALTLDKLVGVDNASEAAVVRFLSADELTCC